MLLGLGAGQQQASGGGGGGSDTPPAVAPYLMACFKPADEKLYLLTSSNGSSFTQLYAAIYTPPSGGLRDPSITFHADKWWIVYTNAGSSFGLASAPAGNLSTWTHERNVSTAAIAGIDSTWAPEFFIDSDGSFHVFFAASTDSNATHKIYETHPTASDWSTWSTPVDIGLGTNYIDPFMVKIGSTYHLLVKNEGAGGIEIKTSPTLTGPTWTAQSSFTGSLGIEGPAVYAVGSVLRVMFDYFTLHQMHYRDTADGFASFGTDTSLSLPYQIQHGTVMKLS